MRNRGGAGDNYQRAVDTDTEGRTRPFSFAASGEGGCREKLRAHPRPRPAVRARNYRHRDIHPVRLKADALHRGIQNHPLPRLQGWNYWDWTGFWSWDIPGTPRDWRYRHHTSRRSDVLWTINQVRFAAAWGEQPGSLAVTMGTVTPNFETFLVRTGDGEWMPSGASTTWKPAPGRSRLDMRVRNTSGVLGPVSFIEVQRSE